MCLSSGRGARGCPPVSRPLVAVASPGEHGLQAVGASDRRLCGCGSAPCPGRFSRIRDQTHVSCVGRWIPYQPATGEAPTLYIFLSFFFWEQRLPNLSSFFQKNVLILYLYIVFYSVQPINNVVIVSGEQWRDSAIHIHVSIFPQTPLPSRLPRNIEKSSMCYIYSRSLLAIILNIALSESLWLKFPAELTWNTDDKGNIKRNT